MKLVSIEKPISYHSDEIFRCESSYLGINVTKVTKKVRLMFLRRKFMCLSADILCIMSTNGTSSFLIFFYFFQSLYTTNDTGIE